MDCLCLRNIQIVSNFISMFQIHNLNKLILIILYSLQNPTQIQLPLKPLKPHKQVKYPPLYVKIVGTLAVAYRYNIQPLATLVSSSCHQPKPLWPTSIFPRVVAFYLQSRRTSTKKETRESTEREQRQACLLFWRCYHNARTFWYYFVCVVVLPRRLNGSRTQKFSPSP